MGSRGPGRITDYPGSSSKSGSTSKESGANDAPPEDRCGKAFVVRLEDVELSDYFKAHGALPRVGTQVSIEQRKRLVAVTNAGEVVGNLPTRYNYLAACMKDGWRYGGTIATTSKGPPAATVTADIGASGS